MPYVLVTPVINLKCKGYCKLPYPGHKNGCPNFDHKLGCPPNTLNIDQIIDFSKPIYIIYNSFNLHEHVKKMNDKHPNWSERQLKCCLYWQPKARKQLKEEVIKFLKEFPEYTIVKCPEANGVDLTETMKNVGINLEWPPKQITYQIVMAGIKKNG